MQQLDEPGRWGAKFQTKVVKLSTKATNAHHDFAFELIFRPVLTRMPEATVF
jgi:hypothetical protein